MNRKKFLANSAVITLGLSLPLGCSKDDNPVAPVEKSELPPFPYLEVSETSNYDIGYKIGEHFKVLIQELYSRQMADKIHNPSSAFDGMSLLEILLSLVDSDPSIYYDPFYNAAQASFPQYLEEMKGTADATGIPLKTIFTNMCMLEIIGSLHGEKPIKKHSPSIKGCSTVSYSNGGKLFLAHNEDFFTSFADLMYVVKVTQPGKPTFLSLNYPGGILGIPPAMNDAGIVYSGNQIDLPASSPGIPLVFVLRDLLSATNLEDAKSKVQLSNIAYSYHLNIGSFKENKLISVEFMPGKSEVYEVSEFYVHTNHFVLPTMESLSTVDDNSLIRRDTLIAKSNNYKNKPNEVNGDLITGWMSSHDAYPNAVCVHLNGGLTVAHSLFDFQNQTWKLYKGNPCAGAYKTIKL